MSEREVQHDPQVIEGEDELPRQPSPPLDPYTPEPGAHRGEGRAFRVLPLTFVALAIVVIAIVVWAATR